MPVLKPGFPLIVSDETIPKEGFEYFTGGINLKGPKVIQDEFSGVGCWEYQLAIGPNRTLRVHTHENDWVRRDLQWQTILLPKVTLTSDHLGPLAILPECSNPALIFQNFDDWRIPEVQFKI